MSGAAHPTHELHRGDVPYEAPFVRSASPNDSLTTAYGADETNLSDVELSEEAFSKKVLAGLRIHEKREEEVHAETRLVVMPRPRRGVGISAVSALDEERGRKIRQKVITDISELTLNEEMHDQVMRSLRWQVRLLEEEEAIETALQRRIRAVQESQGSTSEVDIIMESMMEPRGKGPASFPDDGESVAARLAARD
jgi:hypothetical protein